MTSEQVFAIARDLILLMITALVFWWGRDRKHTSDAVEARFVALERRLDHAATKSSELAGAVQALIGRVDRLPEQLRDTFLATVEAKLLHEESRRERTALWAAVERKVDKP